MQIRVKALQKQISVQELEKQTLQQTISKLQKEKLQIQTEAARESAAGRSSHCLV